MINSIKMQIDRKKSNFMYLLTCLGIVESYRHYNKIVRLVSHFKTALLQ